LSDKELFNKKKGITKKTIFAAKIRELSINMISGMVKANLTALHPHYLGLFENGHFEN